MSSIFRFDAFARITAHLLLGGLLACAIWQNEGHSQPPAAELAPAAEIEEESNDQRIWAERRRLEKRRDVMLQMIRQLMPEAKVSVTLQLQQPMGPRERLLSNCRVILAGTAPSPENRATVVDIAAAVFGCENLQANPPPGSGAKIINNLRVVIDE